MTKSGETDLAALLRGMRPELQAGDFVFALAGAGETAGLDVIGTFREPEGLTLILPARQAEEAGLVHSPPMRQITLTIHSSLEAVGLTAAISARLTRHGISANVVAAYYHDHVFVPAADAERAMAALEALATDGGE